MANVINRKEQHLGKITSKGQITLPISWRRANGDPKHVQLKEKNGSLVIEPVIDESAEWETIFDSQRDGELSGEDFLQMLND
tara:strand:- start:485 stop:730 length:246 start_codon:yes stop_codon:yes gene_type:complete